jgi:hypothetical protein
MSTPNEMMESAKDMMLDGRVPTSFNDWYLIVNFLAHNVAPEIALEACLLMRVLYDIPISEEGIEQIVLFQTRTPLC